jgi:hypothetical protein
MHGRVFVSHAHHSLFNSTAFQLSPLREHMQHEQYDGHEG